MGSVNLNLKILPCLSNKLLGWKPSKVGESCQTSFTNHIWHGMIWLSGFSGHSFEEKQCPIEVSTEGNLDLGQTILAVVA